MVLSHITSGTPQAIRVCRQISAYTLWMCSLLTRKQFATPFAFGSTTPLIQHSRCWWTEQSSKCWAPHTNTGVKTFPAPVALDPHGIRPSQTLSVLQPHPLSQDLEQGLLIPEELPTWFPLERINVHKITELKQYQFKWGWWKNLP